MHKKINLLLAEDDRLMSDGLKSLLATQPDFHVVATIEKPEEAISFCHAHLEIDLILMDIGFKLNRHLNGLELTKQIKARFPGIKILICSMREEMEYVQRAKQVGADGYIIKDTLGEYVFFAIREIAKGNEIWLPIDPDSDPPLDPPTPTQMEVLKYIALGMQSDQIGIELAMREATVSTHRRNIRQKYRINTPGKLTLFAEKCMEIYGTPPDPKLYEELARHTREFEEQIKKATDMKVEPAEEVTVEVKFAAGITGFNNATNRALSRTVEETLRNIRQHASARKVSIHLTELNASWINLTIRDDGKGFDVAHTSSGSSGGIAALRRILAAIGGELAINSSRDSGTTITATLRRTAQR
jgi:Response regulator containing a CheY-like receiver domain and an HTH DNA-binding domain